MINTHSMNPVGQGIAIGSNFYAFSSSRNITMRMRLSDDLMVSGCSDYSKMITKYRGRCEK